jgi:hypothetical protein
VPNYQRLFAKTFRANNHRGGKLVPTQCIASQHPAGQMRFRAVGPNVFALEPPADQLPHLRKGANSRRNRRFTALNGNRMKPCGARVETAQGKGEVFSRKMPSADMF